MRGLPIDAANGTQTISRVESVDEATCLAGWTISGVAVLVAIVAAWIIGI